MKKNYFFGLFVCLALLATTAKAQVSSVSELFGKYHFTANLEVLNDEYSSNFSNDCEVVITASDNTYYTYMVTGFAGGTGTMYSANFSAEDQTLTILNPNGGNYDVLGGSVHMTFPAGTYPYSVWPADSTHVPYNDVVWTYDDATKTITVPDFAVVTVDYSTSSVKEIVAQFTNVKMELTEAENIEIIDLTGEWSYSPGGRYGVGDSSFVYTFKMDLERTDDTNKNYNATLTLDGFDPVNLTGTFDGLVFEMAFDSCYLDKENYIRFGTKASKADIINFNLASENVLTQLDNIYICQDTVAALNQSYKRLQTMSSGSAKREGVEASISWAGKFNVVSTCEVYDATVSDFPNEFDLEIVYDETNAAYYMTSFIYGDITGLTNGGCKVTPASDNKSATVSLSNYYDETYVKSLGGGNFLRIADADDAGTLTLTLNDDGSLTISNFYLDKLAWGSTDFTSVAYYSNITAVLEPFEWFDTFTLSAEVESLNGNTYPAKFIVRFGDAEVYGSTYSSMVAEFFGYNNLTANNSAGNALTIAEDTQSATMPAGIYVGGSYPSYFKIYDINGTTNALNFVVNEDGSISMDDFIITTYDNDPNDWTLPAVEANAAKYTNVVLTRGDTTGINEVVADAKNNAPKGIFDLQGRRIEKITSAGIYIVNGKKVIVK